MFWSTEARPKSLQGHRGQTELALLVLKEGGPILQNGASSPSARRALISFLTPPPEFGVQGIDETRYIKDILCTIGFDFIIKFGEDLILFVLDCYPCHTLPHTTSTGVLSTNVSNINRTPESMC